MIDRRRGARGQVLIVLALAGVLIFGMGAVALDQSIGMADRRDLQAYADAASLAGSREYSLGNGSDAAHLTALQYLKKTLPVSSGFGFPVTGKDFSNATITCVVSPLSCPAGTYTVGPNSDYTITLKDPTTSTLDVGISHSRRTLVAGILGFTTSVTGTSGRATPAGPAVQQPGYALATVGGDAQVHGGGTSSPTLNISGNAYAYGNLGANNTSHSPNIPAALTNYNGTACSPSTTTNVNFGGTSNSLSYNFTNGSGTVAYGVAAPDPFASVSPVPALGASTYTTTAAAKDASGNWMPGIYNGVYPSAGLLNPGVYKIINVTSSLNLGSLTNKIHTASGTSDPTGAAVLVLDSSDTGSLDLSNFTLNGLDDLNNQIYGGLRDPQGTHNFVLYGGSGANGYSGSVTINSGSTTDVSGIVYLPKVSVTTNGSSSTFFTGSAYFSSFLINGSGSGTQVFNWVCGLTAIEGYATVGGLVR